MVVTTVVLVAAISTERSGSADEWWEGLVGVK